MVLPQLPKRAAPKRFDDSATVLVGVTGLVDSDDDNKKTNWYDTKGLEEVLPNRFDGHRFVFSNICAVNWKLSSIRTSKLYRFENCHFKRTTFKGLYWPGVAMDRCRFFECTWENCVFTEPNPFHQIGNEFAKCTVIIPNETNPNINRIKDTLVGYQHTPNDRNQSHDAIRLLIQPPPHLPTN